jgi:glycine oxidase
MDSSYDFVIVGSGLAGAFAAFNLSSKYQVLVLEQADVAAGATGAGAGLVNPFMARKANPVWRWREAFDALETTLRKARAIGLFRKTGVLRPARDEQQADWFTDSADDFPEIITWIDGAAVAARWPAIQSDLGGIFIKEAGSIDLTSLAEALLNAAENLGCQTHDWTTVQSFEEGDEEVVVSTDRGEITTRRLLLCPGADYARWDVLDRLPLHQLKGQTVVVERPYRLGANLPCISGSGYVVPYPDELVLGSTHHHEFDHRDPTQEDTVEILEKVTQMVPYLAEARVVSVAAGVRVTVPGTRLPIIGPVTDSDRVWVFTGLGSKGVLLGALLGRQLPSYLVDPTAIPEEIRVPELT